MTQSTGSGSNMIQLEHEINYLRDLYLEMHQLVRKQMGLTQKAVIKHDMKAAEEVILNERRVNNYELNVDEEVEKFLALHQPVAGDLRIALAILKMSGNAERIGDHAFKICSLLYDDMMSLNDKIIDKLKINDLFEEIDLMMQNVARAFVLEEVDLAKTVFDQDKMLNKMNKKMPERLEKYGQKEKDETISNLILVSTVIGKLERTGDLIKNLAEEIIFYIESEFVKHRKRNRKIRKKMEKAEDDNN